MSESENNTEEQTEKKKKSPLGIILIAFAVLAIGLGYGLIDNAKKASSSEDTNETVAQTASLASVEEPIIQDTKTTESVNALIPASGEAVTAELNIEYLGTPRILGNPDAPVKISEHSSFTCPACAMFHKTNLKDIKKDYIDTGKAYLVFDDFPRNSYDITIGAIARCVPEQAYFNFVQLLFETQKEWLTNKNFLDYVKQNAKLTGASDDKINACANSKELQEILAKRQFNAGENHGVKATPTLIINNEISVSGLADYGEIKEAIDNALTKAAQ